MRAGCMRSTWASAGMPDAFGSLSHAVGRGPRAARQACLALLLLWAFLAPLCATSAPRIGVATMQPGGIFWERFGHNALVVVDDATGEATSYNFGFFDPTEPDFVARFVRGQMRYRLVALPLAQDLATYRDSGRGVSIQWLDLPPDRASALSDALAVNARPENAAYAYQYFEDNCSTRVRDALDRALDGGLRRQLEARSQGSTHRSEAVRLASPAWWMATGFDLGLGPRSDRPMSRWDEAFVPMRLAASLREARNAAGMPLVMREEVVLPHLQAPEPVEAARAWWPWGLAGLAIAGVLIAVGRRSVRGAVALAAPAWLLAALAGALMLYIWFGTAHAFGWANRNVLLFNPLCGLLLAGAWPALRGWPVPRWMAWTAVVVAACAVLAFFMLAIPAQPQRNAAWVALLLPVHAALAWVLWRHADPVRRGR